MLIIIAAPHHLQTIVRYVANIVQRCRCASKTMYTTKQVFRHKQHAKQAASRAHPSGLVGSGAELQRDGRASGHAAVAASAG